MNNKRVRSLNGKNFKNKGPIAYWMSRDQRADDNWALLFAQELAIKYKQPLAVVFCLIDDFLGATFRQYRFMLDHPNTDNSVLVNHGSAVIQFHFWY